MAKARPRAENDARLNALERSGVKVATHRKPRAPRSDGPRTTLRVPSSLAETADRLADDLGISRNDAILRLATRGAEIFETERMIKTRRDQRWQAIVPGRIGPEAEFPEVEEVVEAIRPEAANTANTSG